MADKFKLLGDCGKPHVSVGANCFTLSDGTMVDDRNVHYCWEHYQYEPFGLHKWHKPRRCGYCWHPFEESETPPKCPCCGTYFDVALPAAGLFGMIMLFNHNVYKIEPEIVSRAGRGTFKIY